MPPTRGHDLKPLRDDDVVGLRRMPPTRGHDLILMEDLAAVKGKSDAPHTGARLET